VARIVRWGGPAAVAGGLLWMLVWAHGLTAHGPTQVNEKEVVLGLTWMDSGKALSACFLLFLVGAVAVWARIEHPGPLGQTALAFTVLGLVLLALGAGLQFWTFPWGSYADEAARFDSGAPRYGGIVQALGSTVYTAGVLLLAVTLVRRRAPMWWVGPLLLVTGPASFFLTPVLPFAGLAWLLVGIVLWRMPALDSLVSEC
jgi:hypothetical protein